MSGAIRMVSLSRGHDPRDFVLFAFGGAGPLHAVALARELGIPEVLVPARPGLTNALGCLVADLRQDFVQTVNAPLESLAMDEVAGILEKQRERGIEMNAAEQKEIVDTQVLHSADMQFRGQTHLIRVALPSPRITRQELQHLFETAYFARFQVRLPEIKAAVINLNTSVVGKRRQFPVELLLDGAQRAKSLDGARTGKRRLYAGDGWTEAAVYSRDALPIGAKIEGPAIIEQVDATTVIEPNSMATVDPIGNLRIELSAS
jgi:N-methylhydantoinase A